MSWTAPIDVTGAWIGPDPAPSPDALVQTWIDKAERMIRHRVPDIQARITAEGSEAPPRTDLLDSAIDVTVAMVTRVFRNPTGTRQASETVGTGPYSGTRSVTYGGDQPGALTLLEEELESLLGVRGGAFEINLIPSTSPFYPGVV